MKHHPLDLIYIMSFLVLLLVLVSSCKTTTTRVYSEEEIKIISEKENECEAMTTDNAKCYVDLAILAENSEYCNKIEDREGRKNCEKIVTSMQS